MARYRAGMDDTTEPMSDDARMVVAVALDTPLTSLTPRMILMAMWAVDEHEAEVVEMLGLPEGSQIA